MNFIQLTDMDGEEVVINAATINQFYKFNKRCTRIIFCFEVDGDYAYEDVKESMSEILSKL